MSADQPSPMLHGRPFIAAGAVAMLLGAGVDRVLYELTGRSNDLTGLFVFAAAKRTLATTGGVLVAVGVGLEIVRRSAQS